MEKVSELALQSQTVCSAVHFVLFLVCWPTIISLLTGFLNNDRLTFNCYPEPSDVTKHLCYGDYISSVSPLLTPLDFAYITSGILGFAWIVFILYSALALRRIKKSRNESLSKRFRWKFLLHVCIQLAVLSVMMGLFCGFQTLHLPVVNMCSQGNTTQIPTNQVNMTCNDLHDRQKSKLNIGVVAIMAISIVLCIVSIIHLFLTWDDFLKQLLDQEGDSPEPMPLGELKSDQNRHVLVQKLYL